MSERRLPGHPVGHKPDMAIPRVPGRPPDENAFRRGLHHLRGYTAAHGHSSVPARHVTDDGFNLGTWVKTQRAKHKKGNLSEERTTALTSAGMVWDGVEVYFQTGLAHLRDYVVQTGHGRVHWLYVADDGFNLGEWVISRRVDRRKGTLSPVRIAELTSAGMVWDGRAKVRPA